MNEFEAAYQTVQKLGDDWEINNILYEIETLHIRYLYYSELEKRPGQSAQIRRELAKRFHRRSDRSIQYAIYGK